MALPAGVLSTTDVTCIIDTLARGLNDSRSAPPPPFASVITDSMSCEIAAGETVVRVEVRSTRMVAPLPSSNEAVPTPQIDQLSPTSGDFEPASFSLPDSLPASNRAAYLTESILRALGEYDLISAHQQGVELDTLVTTAQKGDLPPEILAECYLTLCRVQLAMVRQNDEASATYMARARDYLERAKNVPRT